MKKDVDPKVAIGICVAVVALVGGAIFLKNTAFRAKPDTAKAEAAGAKMMEYMQKGGGGAGAGAQNKSPYDTGK